MAYIAAMLAAMGSLPSLGVPSLVAQSIRTPASDSTSSSTTVRVLSLDQAVQLAEQQSPTIRIAKNALRRAQGQQYQARSTLLPQLNATGNYTRTLKSQYADAFSGTSSSSDSSSTGGFNLGDLPFGQANAYTLGLSASQNLFTGGSATGQIRSANAGRRSAEIQLTAQQAQLTLDVTQAYYNAALADQLLSIAQATLSQADETLRQTQAQNQVGNISEFDLLRATVSRDNQRPVVLQREHDRETAYLSLKQLLNIPLETPLRLVSALEDSTVAISGVAIVNATRPDTLTEHRASVRSALEDVTAQQGLLTVAHAQRLPTLQLSSQYYGVAYPRNGLPGRGDFLPNWTVTLATSLPLFAGGRIHGQEMVAEANVRDARDRLVQAKQAAGVDARIALNDLRQAEATLSASQGTAGQAERAYRIAEVRYREGLSTQLELTDSRNLLSQALVNRAQAARNVLVARVKLALLPDLPVASSAAAQAQAAQEQQQQQQQQAQQQTQQTQQTQQSSTQPQGPPNSGSGF